MGKRTKEGTPFLRDTPSACSQDQLLSQTAQFRGVSCQELFQQAFTLVGFSEAYARAVFSVFLQSGKKEEMVPRLVKMYCSVIDLYWQNSPTESSRHFCFGCQVHSISKKGIYDAYDMCFTDVNEKFLQRIANSNDPLGLTDHEEVLDRMILPLCDVKERADS